MDCCINAKQKCKQAAIEQAPSATSGRISDPTWGDNSLQRCEVRDGSGDHWEDI